MRSLLSFLKRFRKNDPAGFRAGRLLGEPDLSQRGRAEHRSGDVGRGALLPPAALDEEETSRIDTEDGQTLIIIDVPAVEKDDAVVYSTLPLGIIVTDKHIITVCLKETSILKDFQDGLVRFAETQKRTSFILYMLLQVAKRFLQYLKQIDKIYNYMERQLYKSQRNKELIQLLDLEKSLVYFNTSLKANEVTLERFSGAASSPYMKRTTTCWRTCSLRCARPSRWLTSTPPSSLA